MLNKRAFTLIEMLVVVIIIGVILAIAIPAVSNISSSNRNKMYKSHMNIVDQKINLFIDQNKGQLRSKSCVKINYKELVNQEFITESDVTCTGTIVIKKSGNGKSFMSEKYLDCIYKGDSNNKLVTEASQGTSAASGCSSFDF